MGTWLRTLNGYRRCLQQDITFRELGREYPELDAPRMRAKIPNPWDDYPRRDAYDRCWKRHRKEQFRASSPPKPKTPKVKVEYDTQWVGRSGRYVWVPYINKYGESRYSKRTCAMVRYRVRERYRRHSCR